MFGDDKGTWFVMFLFNFVSLYMGSELYNYICESHFAAPEQIIGSGLGITYVQFCNVAAFCTWLGDFVTSAMVGDMILQSLDVYPFWLKDTRVLWKYGGNGWYRIISFWIICIATTGSVCYVITNPDIFDWDDINTSGWSTSEFTRCLLASFITVFDLIIVMQDWDFPWCDWCKINNDKCN